MRKMIGFIVVSLSLGMAACGSSTSGNTSQNGEACATANASKCVGAVWYNCSVDANAGTQTWVAWYDCGQSATSGCSCQVVSGQAICATGSDSSAGTCDGKKLN
jgi:hypothetical protein